MKAIAETILYLAYTAFFVYGIHVLSKWKKAAKKVSDACDELHEEIQTIEKGDARGMNIFCRVEDCRYIECGMCKRGDISISEDFECEDYESYLDAEEWKKPFWKRMKDAANNRICRVKYFGKEIEYNGRKFFAESRSEYAYLTDALTGMGSGTIEFVKNNFEKVLEAASRGEIPLQELPAATYDEKTRTFDYEKEGGAEQ